MGSTGAIIMAFFGAVFGAMTLRWQFHVGPATLVLPFLVFGVLTIAALSVMRMPGEGVVPSPRASRAIMWSAIGEGVGLFVAVNVVVNLHRPDLQLPAIALVVGLHFLPIAWAAPFRPFYALGGALVAAAAAGTALGPPIGGTLAGAASALALWIAAVAATGRDRRAKLD